MKTAIKLGVVGAVACVLLLAGCKKQSEPAKPAGGTPAEQGKTTTPAVSIDENKAVAEVKAEAEKMNVEQLKAAAMKYKDAIAAKKADLEKLTAKLKGIPVAEQLGAEAKAIQADIQNVNKSVAALTERFQVYYGKLKEMGGNLSGLEL